MKIKYSYIFFLLSAFGFAQEHPYSYQRELMGVEAQWHKVILPYEIFEKTKTDFSDIRIIGLTANKDTLVAPYIFQLASEKLTQVAVSFKLINQAKNDKGSYFTFETPIESAVNQIQLDFKPLNFDWKVTLEGSQNQQEWFSILTDYRILSINSPDTNFQYTLLNFPIAKYRYFRLLIQDEEYPGFSAAKLLFNSVTAGNYNTYPIKLNALKEDKKNKLTEINLDLKSNVPVSKLTLGVKNNYDYFRAIHISYLSDSVQTEKGWKYGYSKLISGTINSFEKSEFAFKSTLLKKLKIVIENQDNVPLQIDSIQVEGYVHEVIARFTTPATYFLTYGNPLANKPNYDIAQFSDQIPTNLKLLQVGNEQFIKSNTKDAKKTVFQNSFWLWGVMILIILLLGWFSLKMIRQK